MGDVDDRLGRDLDRDLAQIVFTEPAIASSSVIVPAA